MKKGRKSSGKTRKELIAENKKLLDLLTHCRMMLNSSYGIGNTFNRFNIQKVTSRVPYPVDSLEVRRRKIRIFAKEAGTEILNNKKEDEQNGRCTKM